MKTLKFIKDVLKGAEDDLDIIEYLKDVGYSELEIKEGFEVAYEYLNGKRKLQIK